MRNGLVGTRRRLVWLNVAILGAFGMILLAATYWALLRGPEVLERTDNPRLVEAELKIWRGAILDVNSLPLAITRQENGEFIRDYPVPQAAPTVGYYSLRYGTAGIEEAFDTLLRGESTDFWSNFWRIDLLGEPQTGRDVRLTIDSRWQEESSDLLGDRRGAMILFSLPDVEIVAMASSPGYDPKTLDSDFERLAVDENAPLLNRVTQGQYQPGLLLQPFLMAIAQRDGVIDLDEPGAAMGNDMTVRGVAIPCQSVEPETPVTWAETLVARCPGPVSELGRRMGADKLQSALQEFGLTEQPDWPLAAETDQEARVDDAVLAAIGYDALAVSPLQVALALATLANDGQHRAAQIVAASQDEQGQWIATEQELADDAVVPAAVARRILNAFSHEDGLLEHDVMVLSGPDAAQNSWYLGLAPAEAPRYGLVVVVEDDRGASYATEIGRDLLKSVLDPAQS